MAAEIARRTVLAWLASASTEIEFELNDDGGWCWFQDERALVLGERVILGTVASGHSDPGRRGWVEITDWGPNGVVRSALHRPDTETERKAWLDDHNAPALLERRDGRILAVYCQHGRESRIYYRVSKEPGQTKEWGPERVFEPSTTSRVTYSNLHRVGGRIYNFFRGLDNSYKPSYIYSDDEGETWTKGNVVIQVPARVRHRPYVRYAGDGRETVHLFYTEGHPRDFDNSVYHVYLRDGQLHRSDGTPVARLEDGLKSPDEGTQIFRGDASNVAWTSDVHLDTKGRPVVVYSVQKDGAGKGPGQGGEDHRYRWARWDGRRWMDEEIAYAGRRLYAGEDDYTGNVCLDPQNVNVVYASASVDPRTGRELAGGGGRYQIFRGERKSGRWQWQQVTRSADADNIRPVVPIGGKGTVLLWLQGKMTTYTDYRFAVMGERMS